MIFDAKVWVDRSTQYPTRRILTDATTQSTQTVTVERDEGDIYAVGDALNATNLNDLETRIYNAFNSVFPVGIILPFASETDPNDVLVGTWKRVASGQMLIGASSTYPLGSTGGEATHKLTVNEIPVHRHTLKNLWKGSAGTGSRTVIDGFPVENCSGQYSISTENAGSGVAHNNLPPYLAVNYWQRQS